MEDQGDRAKINQAVRTDIRNSVLCWLATIGADGVPNVTPKEIFSSYGEHMIVVADIASSNTVNNIRRHPAVCVSFIDPFRQRGFKITGTATIVGEQDGAFSELGSELLRMAGTAFPVRHIIGIEIDRI